MWLGPTIITWLVDSQLSGNQWGCQSLLITCFVTLLYRQPNTEEMNDLLDVNP